MVMACDTYSLKLESICLARCIFGKADAAEAALAGRLGTAVGDVNERTDYLWEKQEADLGR
jgi:hypothetical protein